MKRSDWDELAFLDEQNNTVYESKKDNKQRKRKWREIETIKERQRLRRELTDIYQYTF